MFEVTVSAQFTATHQLRRADGSHEPAHGHEWRVCVTYAGDDLDEMGLLVDFTAVRARLKQVLAALHDRQLNELPAFGERNPSAESVAVYVAERMTLGATGVPGLRCVEVEEEPGCVARYFPKHSAGEGLPCG